MMGVAACGLAGSGNRRRECFHVPLSRKRRKWPYQTLYHAPRFWGAAMAWQVRHQGSAQEKSLSAAQIAQGLRDGILDPLDEVKGEKDTAWRSLENHPSFTSVVEEVETPPPAKHEE